MTLRCFAWLILTLGLGVGVDFVGCIPPARAADPEVSSEQLPRVRPTEPAQALSTFQVKKGFRLELAAAEPAVVSPVALCFDENGRAYVVEMRDYSERRPEKLGRIRLLEDADGDGKFERSTVFAADLPWPTAVACWDGGVFVGVTPDILYLKDTNGDGVADVREVIFTGFASDYAPFETNKLNVQAMLNSFNWSLDNRIHGATSFSAGHVQLADTPFVRAWLERPKSTGAASGTNARPAGPLNLRGRDFSFDPRTLELRAESGGGQHGLSFDNRGRKYVCSNSSHLQTLLYEERYAARNSFAAMPRALAEIAVDGGAAPVFRISPDEPWRVIRTQWRVGGLVPGPVEGGGRPSGYFTGATGVTIYRGNAFPDDMLGDVFVADCGSNLIHHKKLHPDGLSVRGERAPDELKSEFVASRDNWFRPVQFANAPDGTLYVCDMYREIIEHPWSLPPTLKKHLDLNSGNDRGRIYRIVPAKFKQPRPPRLGKATALELVRLLEHANGWHRDTAARLLCERADRSAIPALRKLAADSPSELGRLHALSVLGSLGGLEERQLVQALADPASGVRRQAVRLSEPFLRAGSPRLLKEVAQLSGDRDPEVRCQTAFSLGESSEPSRLDALLRILAYRDSATRSASPDNPCGLGDPLMRAAVLNSLGSEAAELCRRDGAASLYADCPPGSARAFFSALAQTLGARAHPTAMNDVFQLIERLFRSPVLTDRRQAVLEGITLAAAFGDGLRQNGHSLSSAASDGRVRDLFTMARRASESPEESEELRLASVRLLAHDVRGPETVRLLLSFLGAPGVPASASSPALQNAALNSLSTLGGEEIGSNIVSRWPAFTPALRSTALTLLLARPERTRLLLDAIEGGTVARSELSLSQGELLRRHKEPTIRDRAQRLLEAPPSSRAEALAALQPALQLTGSASRGQKLFTERCATCHRLSGSGQTLGPDLVTMKNAGKEKILVAIVDPNREVNANYLSYLVETRDGETLSGLIASESAASITLRQPGGIDSVLLRTRIKSMQTQGKSFMPEGLEAGLGPQDMADLLEFLIEGK
jgi:putative membrane-bound dehydrogenase-like protein